MMYRLSDCITPITPGCEKKEDMQHNKKNKQNHNQIEFKTKTKNNITKKLKKYFQHKQKTITN